MPLKVCFCNFIRKLEEKIKIRRINIKLEEI